MLISLSFERKERVVGRGPNKNRSDLYRHLRRTGQETDPSRDMPTQYDREDDPEEDETMRKRTRHGAAMSSNAGSLRLVCPHLPSLRAKDTWCQLWQGRAARGNKSHCKDKILRQVAPRIVRWKNN